MSRSLIACAIDAGTTTMVRVKSTGASSCAITGFKTVRYGLDALQGPKPGKAFAKLSSALGPWQDEPLAIAISPRSILTLPTWYPAGASRETCEQLGRLEAGLFLKQVDAWSWRSLPMSSPETYPESLEPRISMFYPAQPAQEIDDELGRRRKIESSGLHFESFIRLTSDSSEPMAILELEESYAAFLVSKGGRAEYFRYWPVNNSSEREFFAITELGNSQAGIVNVTGLAADTGTIQRIARTASRRLLPLGLPPQVSLSNEAKGCPSSTGVVRAALTGLMALSDRSN